MFRNKPSRLSRGIWFSLLPCSHSVKNMFKFYVSPVWHLTFLTQKALCSILAPQGIKPTVRWNLQAVSWPVLSQLLLHNSATTNCRPQDAHHSAGICCLQARSPTRHSKFWVSGLDWLNLGHLPFLTFGLHGMERNWIDSILK